MSNENQTNKEEICSGAPDQNKQAKETVKRPILLSILCIMGFFGIAINGLQLFSNMSGLGSLYGELFPIAMFLVLAIKLTGLIAFWKMRAWGVYVFTFSILLDIVMSVFFGIGLEIFSFILLIVPTLMIAYGFTLIAKGRMEKGFFPEEEKKTDEDDEEE